MQYINLRSIREDQPGEKWQTICQEYWAAYKAWYLSQGHQARPGYVTCRKQLVQAMPELESIYDNLVELAGGGDLAARFLSLYCPPPFLAGCSQAIWTRDQPTLIRNYDYSPQLFEAVLLYTNWCRPVIAMCDCLWGALDGINDAGLAVALAFGGRKITGDGFGVPLILRYILETCDDTPAALQVLQRIKSHMAYNISLVDAHGSHATVFISPQRAPVIHEQVVSTNHQDRIEWEDYANASATVERQTCLEGYIKDKSETLSSMVAHFMASPLYQTHWERGFGTLYTAAYTPHRGEVILHWPRHNPLRQSFESFDEQTVGIMFRGVRSYVK